MSLKKRDAAYWRRRVERDYPEIAERLERGELPSVRAAAIAAGLIQPPTALAELKRAWRKADAEARAAFLAEISLELRVAQTARGGQEARRSQGQGRSQGELFAARRAGAAPAAVSLVVDNRGPGPATFAVPRPGDPASSRDAPRDASREAPRAAPAAREPPLPLGSRAEPGPETGSSARRRLGRLFGFGASKEGGNGNGAHSPGEGAVQVGQRYVKLDAGPMQWEVQSVFEGPQAVPHARIVCVEEPDTVRVVSLAALADRKRYHRV